MKKTVWILVFCIVQMLAHDAHSFEQNMSEIVKDAVRVLLMGETYGYWVGPNYWGGAHGSKAGDMPPIDALDAIAMKHDFAYLVAERIGHAIGGDAGKKAEYHLKQVADKIAVKDAKRLDPDPKKWRPPALDEKKAKKAHKTLIDLLSINKTKHHGLKKLIDPYVYLKISNDLVRFYTTYGLDLKAFDHAISTYFTHQELEKVRKGQAELSEKDLRRLTQVFWRHWYKQRGLTYLYPKISLIPVTTADRKDYRDEFDRIFATTGGSIPETAYQDFIRLRKLGASAQEAKQIIMRLRPGHYALDRMVAKRLIRIVLRRTPARIIAQRRAHIRKRLAQLGHDRLLYLLDYMGIKIKEKDTAKFMNCLCIEAHYGAIGTRQFYHPDTYGKYNPNYSCQQPGPPCIVSGFGCTRHPLPGPDKTPSGPWSYCLKTYKFTIKRGSKKASLSLVQLIEEQLRLYNLGK